MNYHISIMQLWPLSVFHQSHFNFTQSLSYIFFFLNHSGGNCRPYALLSLNTSADKDILLHSHSSMTKVRKFNTNITLLSNILSFIVCVGLWSKSTFYLKILQVHISNRERLYKKVTIRPLSHVTKLTMIFFNIIANLK